MENIASPVKPTPISSRGRPEPKAANTRIAQQVDVKNFARIADSSEVNQKKGDIQLLLSEKDDSPVRFFQRYWNP